jgi:polar amino acid transport system ATP-binding protein
MVGVDELTEAVLVASPPAPGVPAVEIEHLSKSFGRVQVLRDISITVHQGEVMSIIGRSGAGKSTLIRCVNNLEQPDSGSIKVFGDLVGAGMRPGGYLSDKDAARQRAGIGMVFQRFNLFPHLSAEENVAIAPRIVRGQGRERARDVARDLLERVGLGKKLRSYPSQLSGGEQQRVAIARALATGPRLMLFDEATSALDPEMVGEVLDVMRQLVADGLTMIVVTHEMAFAAEVSDRVCYMDAGEIIEVDRPGVVLRNPRQARTREFLAREHARESAEQARGLPDDASGA